MICHYAVFCDNPEMEGNVWNISGKKKKKKKTGPRKDSVEDVGMLYIGEKKDISHTSVPPPPKQIPSL